MPRPASCLRLQHDRAGPVAEQDATGPVLPVGDFRERLGPDDQGAVDPPVLDELLDQVQRVDKAAARRGHVERPRLLGPQRLLHEAGRGGKDHLRRDGGHDDQLEVFGAEPAYSRARLAASVAR